MQVTGNLREAWRSSERALALDRTSPSGFTNNPDIYLTGVKGLNALGQTTDAIVLARSAIAKLPSGIIQVPMRVELSRSLFTDRQLDEALKEVNVALAIRPSDQDALQLRSQIQAALAP